MKKNEFLKNKNFAIFSQYNSSASMCDFNIINKILDWKFYLIPVTEIPQLTGERSQRNVTFK